MIWFVSFSLLYQSDARLTITCVQPAAVLDKTSLSLSHRQGPAGIGKPFNTVAAKQHVACGTCPGNQVKHRQLP
jgi:hypothetical protein